MGQGHMAGTGVPLRLPALREVESLSPRHTAMSRPIRAWAVFSPLFSISVVFAVL